MPPKVHYKKQDLLTTEQLKKLVKEANIPVREIETSIGMPIDTLEKAFRGVPDKKTGYIRTVPAKWIEPIIKYVKKRKVEKEELLIEVKEVLEDHNIEVPEEEIDVPDVERKLHWINKISEAYEENN